MRRVIGDNGIDSRFLTAHDSSHETHRQIGSCRRRPRFRLLRSSRFAHADVADDEHGIPEVRRFRRGHEACLSGLFTKCRPFDGAAPQSARHFSAGLLSNFNGSACLRFINKPDRQAVKPVPKARKKVASRAGGTSFLKFPFAGNQITADHSGLAFSGFTRILPGQLELISILRRARPSRCRGNPACCRKGSSTNRAPADSIR